ncbi:hypothetical protein VTH06DRAFT_4201 [Thermothelomyces fergusii]
MADRLDDQTLRLVFQSRPDILAGIQKAADTPERIALFNDIASFVYEQTGAVDAQNGPASKRRRVDSTQLPTQIRTNGQGHGAVSPATSRAGVDAAAAAAAEPVLLEIKDISVSVPQRKKYDLCFTKHYLYARASGTAVPVQGIVYPWADIDHAFYLPVPDKSQAQYNYVLLPRGSYLPTTKQAGASANDRQQLLEPLVFTVPATAPKPGTVAGPSAAAAETVSDTYSSLFHWALAASMRSAGNHGCEIVASDPRLFHSAARQSHRPGEKAVHVKAFRGTKDGFLFFLRTGILWGFKKPLVFLPLDRIVAVSYTNVLRTTFNIVIELYADADADADAVEKEVEFAMLDQEDHQAIDEGYVRRHGLANRSMAEQRRAKRQLAENHGRKPAAGPGGDETAAEGADGLTELERAQREAEQRLQDEEDELEEDYDPGSDSDSDGEGGSSSEEDENEDGEEEEEEEGDGMQD